MSILQEYEWIRREMGEEKWNKMDEYCITTDTLLSDVLYRKSEYEKFEQWLLNQNKENNRGS